MVARTTYARTASAVSLGCGWAPSWADRIEEHYELAPDDYRGGNPDGVLRLRMDVDNPQ